MKECLRILLLCAKVLEALWEVSEIAVYHEKLFFIQHACDQCGVGDFQEKLASQLGSWPARPPLGWAGNHVIQ